MASKWITAVLILAGIVNGLPLLGVVSGGMLQTLYAVSLDDPNLVILMRHRAVLFGLIGAFLIASIWIPSWRTPALIAGLISMLSFCVLAWAQGDFNPAIRKLIVIDLVTSVAVMAALVMRAR